MPAPIIMPRKYAICCRIPSPRPETFPPSVTTGVVHGPKALGEFKNMERFKPDESWSAVPEEDK
jgi:hypothetical protein